MRVGVFDSGAGGLTVAKPMFKSNLFETIVYYGDTARVPYGNKKHDTIIKYALESLAFFEKKNIDLLVIACNTVSVLALDELKQKAPFPVLGVVESGVRALMRKSKSIDDKILIIGTKNTISSEGYQKMLKQNGFHKITAIATGLLVPLVEEGLLGGAIVDETIKYYLSDVAEPDLIILGCTHFPLLHDSIQSHFPNSKLIHSGEIIVEIIMDNCPIENHNFNTSIEYHASDDLSSLLKRAEIYMGTK